MKLKSYEGKIDSLMQNGYDLIEKGRTIEACDKWLEAWMIIRRNIPENVTILEEIDNILSNMLQCVYNWCQDLEMELHNAGTKDKKYFHKRIEFCRDFYKIFRDEKDELLIPGMKKAEGDAYFTLGEIEKGDERFREIVKEHPNYIWSYISWGDHYCIMGVDKYNDYKKAERYYIQALEKIVELGIEEELDTVYERLKDLYNKTGESNKMMKIINHYNNKIKSKK